MTFIKIYLKVTSAQTEPILKSTINIFGYQGWEGGPGPPRGRVHGGTSRGRDHRDVSKVGHNTMVEWDSLTEPHGRALGGVVQGRARETEN